MYSNRLTHQATSWTQRGWHTLLEVEHIGYECVSIGPQPSSFAHQCYSIPLSFAYDGLGDRIRETGPSGAQTYTDTVVASGAQTYTDTVVASGDAMLYLKANVSGTLTKTAYLYAGSLLVATVSGTTTSYVHEDVLGDTRLVTQKPHSSVVVVFSTNYLPFGVQYAASGTDPNVKYTGQWDEALGLYWDHARFYDPTLGRFVSADPVLGSLSRPQTQDRYAYVANNPLRSKDPSGRFLEIIIGAIIGGVVGYVGCGLATGGWASGECGEAALGGAAVGALAGLTFGASLALAGAAGLGTASATAATGFTFAGGSGLAAFAFAGAVSGGVAGAAGYFTSGGIAVANGRSWQFSSNDLVNSVAWGEIFGAAGGAASYGAGYAAPSIRTWWNENVNGLAEGASINPDDVEAATQQWLGRGDYSTDWQSPKGFQVSRDALVGGYRYQVRFESWDNLGSPPHMNFELVQIGPDGSGTQIVGNHVYVYDQ